MGSIKDLEKMLIDFVDEYSDMYAVYIGKPVEIEFPEDEKVVCYYLLTNNGGFDWDRSDRLGDLMLKADVSLRDFFVMEWPCREDEVSQYDFLERCIYKKAS